MKSNCWLLILAPLLVLACTPTVHRPGEALSRTGGDNDEDNFVIVDQEPFVETSKLSAVQRLESFLQGSSDEGAAAVIESEWASLEPSQVTRIFVDYGKLDLLVHSFRVKRYPLSSILVELAKMGWTSEQLRGFIAKHEDEAAPTTALSELFDAKLLPAFKALFQAFRKEQTTKISVTLLKEPFSKALPLQKHKFEQKFFSFLLSHAPLEALAAAEAHWLSISGSSRACLAQRLICSQYVARQTKMAALDRADYSASAPSASQSLATPSSSLLPSSSRTLIASALLPALAASARSIAAIQKKRLLNCYQGSLMRLLVLLALLAIILAWARSPA